MKKITIYLSNFIIIGLIFLAANCKKKASFIDPNNPEPPVAIEIIDTTTKVYDADDSHIQYSGRISFANTKKPKFSAPGVYIKTKFKGVACSVIFQDQFRWGKKNYYDVMVDDITYKITPISGTTLYPVVSGLTYGEHTICFMKRTQAEIGYCEFMGFEFKGEIITPEAKPTRKIEIIGNSISCGEGVDATTSSDCTDWGIAYHNCNKAFGALLGKKLNAEYHITGVSGIGMAQNYGSTGETMPQRYTHLYLENPSSEAWDVTRFVPDAIIIELGTNDFSATMDSATLTPIYITFVNTIRSYYPNAHIFSITSPLLSDGWPSGTTNATELNKSLSGVLNHFQTSGDSKFHKISISNSGSNSNANSCWHPNAAGQQVIANQIEPYIKSALGW